MPARIRIYGKEATFTQGHWTCDDDSLLAMLEALADPRANTEEQEHLHALYAAGRFGGAVATPEGQWQTAPHPEAEIKLEDFAPATRSSTPESLANKAGWLGFLKRKK
ncbi:hypothetical protein [Deinococcus aquatilis]|uniref:hypothetical protein n=1 Tax=Deinococcus aquatilis TaxID=519440 RepID=UPI00037DEC7E|nr:hypothetical protein [Deinococcus aquatilis]